MPTTDWVPELSDVGAILRARTKDNLGNELGTFDDSTRPTGDQALVLMSQGVSDVAMVIGSEVPITCWDDARYVAAVNTALKIELSYFPEQINTGRSPYPQLKQLFDDSLRRLLMAVESSGGGIPGGGSGAPGAPMKPVYAFPVVRRYGSWHDSHQTLGY